MPSAVIFGFAGVIELLLEEWLTATGAKQPIEVALHLYDTSLMVSGVKQL